MNSYRMVVATVASCAWHIRRPVCVVYWNAHACQFHFHFVRVVLISSCHELTPLLVSIHLFFFSRKLCVAFAAEKLLFLNFFAVEFRVEQKKQFFFWMRDGYLQFVNTNSTQHPTIAYSIRDCGEQINIYAECLILHRKWKWFLHLLFYYLFFQSLSAHCTQTFRPTASTNNNRQFEIIVQ